MIRLILLLIAIPMFAFFGTAQSVTATYNAGNIPTPITNYSATCNGPVTPLVVTIPAGANVTGIDITYDFVATGGAYMSEQRSRIHCQETGNTEITYNGTGGGTGGTENYTRNGVNIANGISATGTLTFEMQAWRTWGGTNCDQVYQYINNNTWSITVHYTIPGPMIYGSSTTTQASTATVENCVGAAEILGVEVVTTGSTPAINLTQLALTTAGTTNLGDLTAINVYYTGNSNAFATGTLFGSVAPGGAVTVNGTQTLLPGTNYFWVEYALNAPTTIGNNLDGTCTSVTVDGTGYAPTVSSPAGQRPIGACNPSPGGVATSLQTWFNANAGTTGNPVTQWANQGPNANVPFVSSTNGGPLESAMKRANFNNIVNTTGDYIGTYHYEVPQRTDVISGNEVTMYCAYQGSSHPDLSFNFHSSVSGGGGGSGNQWYSWGFRHGGLGTLFSSGIAFPYDNVTQAQMSANSGFAGLHGTESSAGGNCLNGSHMTTANTGAWYSGTGDQELSIGYWPGWGMSRGVMEAILWDRDLTQIERFKVETYLAIKYGITLGMNGTSMDYISPADASVIWDVSANGGYNFDIAGIGRADAAGLDQRKSHTTNGTAINTYNDVVTIANGTNFASPAAFSNDRGFIVWGHNNSNLINTGALVNYPTDNGELIQTIFSRRWKAQESGSTSTVTLEFDLSSVVGPSGVIGANDLANARLLVDEDDDYTNGATSIAPLSWDNTTGIVYFQYDFQAPTGNHMDQLRGYFFTIGSTDAAMAPLPVEMVDYTVKNEECSNLITWSTLSEAHSDYFVIERSMDMVNWDFVTKLYAAGSSQQQLDYMYRDVEFEQNGPVYYRLTQFDTDGKAHELNIVGVNAFCYENIEPIAYPNPMNDQLFIESPMAGTVELTDINGRRLRQEVISKGINEIRMNGMAEGTYLVTVHLANDKTFTQKIIKH